MESPVTCALCNSLGSKDEIFLSNTDEAKENHARIHFIQLKISDDGITEDNTLQRCFVKVERQTLSLIECRRSLRSLCTSLLKQQLKSSKIVCNVCGNGFALREYCMLNHASCHLEVRLCECRHCDCSASAVDSILYHIRRVHNIKKPTNKDFKDKTVEHFGELTSSIKHCFSTSYPRATGPQRQFVIRSDCQDKRSFVHLCRYIFLQRSKPSSLDCNLCGLQISLRGSSLKAHAMYEHAAAHLETKVFACRHCNQPLSTKRAVTNHLRNMHQIIDATSGDFDDQSEKFHSEHLKMIERCFSVDQVKLEVPSAKDKSIIKAEASVRHRTNGSCLAVERNLFYNRQMKKIVDSEGKVKCSLCSKRLIVKLPSRTVSKVAFLHAEMHLQKPLYRCTVCENQFNTKQAIFHHLKGKHALGMEKNYECVADEFHEEFMAMLSKCYPAQDL